MHLSVHIQEVHVIALLSRPRSLNLETRVVIKCGRNLRVTIPVSIDLLSVDLTLTSLYPNGSSCSMPEELQEPMMRIVPGLENVHMVRSVYGVEYDHIDPLELQREL
ncbi:hypothetical protein JVT61DRAFT_7510 [Boletus reticuloceps]|uniref:MnmG N-terminal domain-containing protein n=1 Tax=Boletus reticuloceps TaxID=495285 RepID=A0A8I3A654_9AGAM|nr:hypothetical protein JVT61DRAFT_7510 [Boletus reticuloceps]